MSDIAVLAAEADSALIALADQVVPTPDHDALAAVQDARRAAAAELRAEAARRAAVPADDPAVGTAGEIAGLLGQLADQLEQQRAAAGVDRLVHELLSDLLADALHAPAGERGAYLGARAFALRVLARQAPLWPGAGPRLGCAYGYDSVLAVVRRSAEATGA